MADLNELKNKLAETKKQYEEEEKRLHNLVMAEISDKRDRLWAIKNEIKHRNIACETYNRQFPRIAETMKTFSNGKSINPEQMAVILINIYDALANKGIPIPDLNASLEAVKNDSSILSEKRNEKFQKEHDELEAWLKGK